MLAGGTDADTRTEIELAVPKGAGSNFGFRFSLGSIGASPAYQDDLSLTLPGLRRLRALQETWNASDRLQTQMHGGEIVEARELDVDEVAPCRDIACALCAHDPMAGQRATEAKCQRQI